MYLSATTRTHKHAHHQPRTLRARACDLGGNADSSPAPTAATANFGRTCGGRSVTRDDNGCNLAWQRVAVALCATWTARRAFSLPVTASVLWRHRPEVTPASHGCSRQRAVRRCHCHTPNTHYQAPMRRRLPDCGMNGKVEYSWQGTRGPHGSCRGAGQRLWVTPAGG